MRYIIIGLTILMSVQSLSAQEVITDKPLDSLYREDQIYFSVTYNLLGKKLQNMSQNGFSGGFHFGFIRDFPVNEQRNVAFGIGLGVSANSFNQNLKISKINGAFEYEVVNNGAFKRNKFDLYQVELPFEFRWRTSTAETYKFWRVYSGFKLGYIFSSKTKFVSSDESYKTAINDAINKLQYGFTLSVGYDSWNLHIYYALNSIFKDQKLNDESINLNAIKIGLIFYIL